MTTNILKHICDRCGEFVEIDQNPDFSLPQFNYPKNWQHITLGQTGATLDLCPFCNKALYKYLSALNATDMDKACFNEREVI